jgi:hypothetical protein
MLLSPGETSNYTNDSNKKASNCFFIRVIRVIRGLFCLFSHLLEDEDTLFVGDDDIEQLIAVEIVDDKLRPDT